MRAKQVIIQRAPHKKNMTKKELDEKMKKMAGLCCICGIPIIQIVGGKARLLPIFRNHIVKLSNDTLMRIGVCDIDKAKLSSGSLVIATANIALANHKTYWMNNTKYAPKDFEKLTITDPNTNLSKFRREMLLKRHEEAMSKQINAQ